MKRKVQVRFGGEGSESWLGNKLRRTALTLPAEIAAALGSVAPAARRGRRRENDMARQIEVERPDSAPMRNSNSLAPHPPGRPARRAMAPRRRLSLALESCFCSVAI